MNVCATPRVGLFLSVEGQHCGTSSVSEGQETMLSRSVGDGPSDGPSAEISRQRMAIALSIISRAPDYSRKAESLRL